MTVDPTQHVYDDLLDLEQTWPSLLAHRVPGTEHARLRPPLSEDQRDKIEWDDWHVRDEITQRARERALQGLNPDLGLGESPASARVEVLDAITRIVGVVWTVEDEARAALGDSPAIRTRDGQPSPMRDSLRYLRSQLDRIGKHPAVWTLLVSTARKAASTSRYVRGLGETTYRVNEPCPICDCASLMAFPDRFPLIVKCIANPGLHNEGRPVCECHLTDCSFGCHDGGTHNWTHDPANGVDEWTWLAEVLKAQRETRREVA